MQNDLNPNINQSKGKKKSLFHYFISVSERYLNFQNLQTYTWKSSKYIVACANFSDDIYDTAAGSWAFPKNI